MKALAFVSALALTASGLATAGQAQAPVPESKPLPVGTCINMGNMLEPPTEGAWGGASASKADFARIAAAGFDTVRIPVRWHNQSSDKAPYTIDSEWMARVQQIVDWALAEDLNVILNSHHFDPIHDDPLAVAGWHGGVWKQIAQRFAGYPEDKLWFELENEPHKNFNHTNLLETLAPALKEVRALHPTRAVIIGGENWSGIKSLETLPLPEDPNIYPTFHYYDPFTYTHQGAEWTAPDIPPVGRKFPTTEDAAQLAKDVASVQAYITRTGRTPFMGEVGAYDLHIPLADRVTYHRMVNDAFAPTGIGICVWAYSNTFPFYDNDKGTWLPGLLGALGLEEKQQQAQSSASSRAAPASSTSKPKLPPELVAFDEQVPGDLINDPTRIDWASYGDNYETNGRQSADIPGGGAARVFDIKAKGAFPYTVAANVPLLADIGAGDQVTVGFYARTVSTERADGKGIIGVRFQENAAPYGGFGDANVLIGSEWEWYEVTARADKRIRRADAIVALQLAGARQQIEIGQAIVVKGSETIVAKAAATAAPQPTLKDPSTIEMPDSLRAAGQLINDPTQRGWGHGGTAGSWQELDIPEIWLQKATRFTSTRVGENRWDLSTSIPFTTAVKEGDQMMVAVIARTISAETDDGKGLIYARIQGSFPPYEGFGDKVFKIGDRWQMVNLPFTATRAFGPGDATVALHFAGAKQNVEIGPVYVFKTN